jgi:serine protease Do
LFKEDGFDPFDPDIQKWLEQLRRHGRDPHSSMPKWHQQTYGCGFIVSSDGYILTNNHIVDGAKKILAQLADGRKLRAEVVGTDPATDLAVLKIDAEKLPFLEFGDSDALMVGDWVLSIGNPLRIGQTFNAGLVTGKGRSGLGLADYENFIQTNIPLSPGDGGGPLLDLDGKVVAVNTATVQRELGPAIGLAIPSNTAKATYGQLAETGTVQRAFLGIAMRDISANMAETLDLEESVGVIVTEVLENSAAQEAGIKVQDILIEFNGEKVRSADKLRHQVAALKPGTEVHVVILRDGERRSLTVVLGKRPSPKRTASATKTPPGGAYSVRKTED